MKVLVIGAGGREHALVWSIAGPGGSLKSFALRVMPGIAQLARWIPVSQKDLDDLLRVTVPERPDLVVVGPELPLSLGLVDELQRRSIPVFGPTQKAAQLESSKAFAKRFMQRHKIPTAAYAIATSEQQALESIDLFHLPLVIKADGLASGKGVIMCETRREATEAISGLIAESCWARRSPRRDRGVSRRRRDLLPGPDRRKTCCAVGAGAGPQADRGGRYGTEHRRYGRLLDRWHGR